MHPFVLKEIYFKQWDYSGNQKEYAEAAALSAFNRVGTTEDVADVVVFVASEEERWITGHVIDATGGNRL